MKYYHTIAFLFRVLPSGLAQEYHPESGEWEAITKLPGAATQFVYRPDRKLAKAKEAAQ